MVTIRRAVVCHPGVPTHLVQELNVATVPEAVITPFPRGGWGGGGSF